MSKKSGTRKAESGMGKVSAMILFVAILAAAAILWEPNKVKVADPSRSAYVVVAKPEVEKLVLYAPLYDFPMTVRVSPADWELFRVGDGIHGNFRP